MFRYSFIIMISKDLPIQRDDNGSPVIDSGKKYSDKGYIPDWQFMEDYIKLLPYSDRLI